MKGEGMTGDQTILAAGAVQFTAGGMAARPLA